MWTTIEQNQELICAPSQGLDMQRRNSSFGSRVIPREGAMTLAHSEEVALLVNPNPPVKVYLHHAYPMSILSSREEYLPSVALGAR